MAQEQPTGFHLDLRPRQQLAVSIRICGELRQALLEAQKCGRSASLRFEQDRRGQ
ncbi:hypothetical protein MNEG_14150, partial [Monoraphidium neglectum]